VQKIDIEKKAANKEITFYLKNGFILEPNNCAISFTLLAFGSRSNGVSVGVISFSRIGDLFPII
jgi:hypothetical protein